MPSIKMAFRMVNRPLPVILRANDPGFLKAWRGYIPKRYRSVWCVFGCKIVGRNMTAILRWAGRHMRWAAFKFMSCRGVTLI